MDNIIYSDDDIEVTMTKSGKREWFNINMSSKTWYSKAFYSIDRIDCPMVLDLYVNDFKKWVKFYS